MTTYHSKNRHRYLLQCHIVFVSKYRRNIFISNIKELSYIICSKHDINIKYMELDKDHIHYYIDYKLTDSISNIARMIKSYTAYYAWMKYRDYLRLYYKRDRTLWSDGYFVCSMGNVSERILAEYIRNQGK